MRKYIFITITSLIALAATVVVIAGYRGNNFKSPPENLNVSAGQALQELYVHNYNTGKLFMEGRIELFDKPGERTKASESIPFKYYVRGDESYQQLGAIEMINNKHYSVYVHHDKQLIQVNHPNEIPGKQLFSQAALIDSLLKADSSTATVRDAEGGMYMIAASTPGDWGRLEYRIFYSPENYIIRKVEIDMEKPADEESDDQQPQKDLIVITYDKVSKSIENENELFSEKRFIHKKRKGLELAASFSNYQLFNLIP